MSFLQREDKHDILLKTSIISTAVYENNPKEYIENTEWLKSVDHKIDYICFSQNHNLGNSDYFNKLYEIFYLLVKDETNKKIYISFRGTRNISDLLTDAKFYPVFSQINGRFHSGFYKRAEKVPKLYLIEKLIQGYDIILTGHSLGAAVAANITIDILYMLNMTPNYYEKIVFIGYGCPSIADIYFKQDCDQRFKNNFVFIKNENDVVVEILEYVSYQIYNKKTDDPNLRIFNQFLNGILGNLNDDNNIGDIVNHMKLVFGTISRLCVPRYTHFGTLFKLTIAEGLLEVPNFETNDFSKIFNDPGLLIHKVQNHFILNYFRNLKDKYFKNSIDLRDRNREIPKLNINLDLEIDNIFKENISELLIIKMRDNSDVILFIDKLSLNIEYLVAVKLILSDETTVFFQEKDIKQLDNGCFYFKFNCLNDKLYDKDNKLIPDKFVFKFYSHFNHQPIEVMISKDFDKIIEMHKTGSYQKRKIIDDMPFDLLYLHAAFYIPSLERINQNNSNQSFSVIKDELLSKFDSLDEILKQIWNEKPESERIYNQNDLIEMENLAKYYLIYLNIDYEFEAISSLISVIKFETKLIGFRQHIKNTFTDNPSEMNARERLLKSIIPYLYELKKRTCKISSLSKELKNKMFDVSTIQTVKFIGASLIIVIAGIAGTLVAGRVIAESAGFLTTLAGRGGAGVGTAAAAAITNNKLRDYMDSTSYPPYLDYNEAYEIIIKQANQKKKKNYDEDSLYSNEKNYDQNFIYKWPEQKDKIIFEMILLNKQIRDILKKNYIFGAIGTKNAGKSKFVGLIANQNANSHARLTTKISIAYSIKENAVIIDYPHLNSNVLGEKLEFYFTRLLLDHIYLIFDSESKGATDNETKFYNLIKSNNFSGISILYNKSDRVFDFDENYEEDGDENNNDINDKGFQDFKIELYNNLKPESNQRIYFTCIREEKFLSEVIKEKMIKNHVILRDELKQQVFGKIDSVIRLDLNTEDLKLVDQFEKI